MLKVLNCQQIEQARLAEEYVKRSNHWSHQGIIKARVGYLDTDKGFVEFG